MLSTKKKYYMYTCVYVHDVFMYVFVYVYVSRFSYLIPKTTLGWPGTTYSEDNRSCCLLEDSIKCN